MPPGEWAARMRFAAERFGIGPERFWRLSLAEWRALTQAEAPDRMTRGRFERLAQEHPDE